ncbi:uncharacterized protein [Centruroides vittatus]|uniref:uncharacterized protein n=1 Tax=Centruroides vittatus TaxID=120091 RepID=UPI00351050E3
MTSGTNWTCTVQYLQSVNPTDHIIVGEDLNGHVGQQRGRYVQQHGGNGLGARNADGYRILDCTVAHDLALANTFFKNRLTHLATYTGSGHMTQVNYWMVRRQDLKLIKNTEVIPNENIAPQHRPLIMDIRMSQLKKKQKDVN